MIEGVVCDGVLLLQQGQIVRGSLNATTAVAPSRKSGDDSRAFSMTSKGALLVLCQAVVVVGVVLTNCFVLPEVDCVPARPYHTAI